MFYHTDHVHSGISVMQRSGVCQSVCPVVFYNVNALRGQCKFLPSSSRANALVLLYLYYLGQVLILYSKSQKHPRPADLSALIRANLYCRSNRFYSYQLVCLSKSSTIAEGPRDAFVSRKGGVTSRDPF